MQTAVAKMHKKMKNFSRRLYMFYLLVDLYEGLMGLVEVCMCIPSQLDITTRTAQTAGLIRPEYTAVPTSTILTFIISSLTLTKVRTLIRLSTTSAEIAIANI